MTNSLLKVLSKEPLSIKLVLLKMFFLVIYGIDDYMLLSFFYSMELIVSCSNIGRSVHKRFRL